MHLLFKLLILFSLLVAASAAKKDDQSVVHFEEIGYLVPLSGHVHVAMTVNLADFPQARAAIRKQLHR